MDNQIKRKEKMSKKEDKKDKKKKEPFEAPAMIPEHGIKTMADRGVRVMVDTQDLPPETLTRLFQLKGEAGTFVFAPQEVKKIEIPDFQPDFPDEKSPSQRLRGALYVLWEQSGKKEGTGKSSEVFYRAKMEQFINKVTTLLD